MEKKELRDRLVQLCVKAYMFGSEQVIVDLPSLIDFVEQELDKAREEGFEQGYKEAKFDCEMGKEFSKESFKEVVSSVSSKLNSKKNE